MKKFLLIIAMSNFLLPLLGQQEVYFNNRVDINNGYDKGLSIIANNSNYVVGTITDDTIYHYFWQLAFVTLDSLGNNINSTIIGDTISHHMLGNPGALIKYDSSKYFAVGNIISPGGDWVYNRGWLVCLNNNFDTLWSKTYGEKSKPYDTTFVIFQLKKNTHGNLVNAGVRLPVSTPSSIWLMETDSLGNKQWENFIGGNDGYYYQGHSIVQTNDGGYAIGAVKFKIEATGGSMDPLIIKTDSLGNEEWRINPGNPDVDDNKVMLTLDADGNIIAGTDYGTQQSIDNRWAVSKIMKITPSGEIIWNYNYGEPGFDKILLNTTVLNSGNIISNGEVTKFDDGPDIISWILCVDSLGDELWYKEYSLLQGDYSQNHLYDIKQTSDNGLISCGMVIPQVPDTGSVDIWVMKTDSLGCLEAGCDSIVGIENYFQTFKHKFEIYPNPASTNFTIDFKTENTQSINISIFNTFGNKFKEIIVPSGESTKKVDCSSWPAGVYVAVVQKNGYVTKFLINGR